MIRSTGILEGRTISHRLAPTPVKVANDEGWYGGESWYSACLHPAASMGPIEFLGGPPHRWGIHRGNLLSLVMDRVAVLMLLEGAIGLDRIVSLEEYLPKRA